MPAGTPKVALFGGKVLVPAGSTTFNASGTFTVPVGVTKVNITGRGGTGNAGNPGNSGNPGNAGTSGNAGNAGAGAGGGAGGVRSTNNSLQASSSWSWNNCYSGKGGGTAASSNLGGNVACPGGTPTPLASLANNYVALTNQSQFQNNPGQSGASGNSGSAGSAGTVGNPGTGGNPGTAGNPSTGLCRTFPGGAAGNGGNAGPGGAAGNPGAAGTGGSGGNAGLRGGGGSIYRSSPSVSTYTPGAGGSGGNGGGQGTSGTSSVNSTGGFGGGGAGSCNDGTTRAQGFNPVTSPTPGGQTSGGIGGTLQPVSPLPQSRFQGSAAVLQPCFPSAYPRAGGGGGASGCQGLGGGGGGGGRGNLGNPGGSGGAGGPAPAGGAGGSGGLGTPATYNCIAVTPGGSYPISVGPGGQIVVSWNTQ